MSKATLLDELRKLPREEQLEFMDEACEVVGEADPVFDDGEGDGPDGSDLPPELKSFLEERMALCDQDNRPGYSIEETFQNCLKAIKAIQK